jgi:hypothetical protein
VPAAFDVVEIELKVGVVAAFAGEVETEVTETSAIERNKIRTIEDAILVRYSDINCPPETCGVVPQKKGASP